MIFYYHHIFFDWFSKLCAIPCLAFVLYRFLYSKPKNGWSNVHVREKYNSYSDCFKFWDLDHTKAIKSDEAKG